MRHPSKFVSTFLVLSFGFTMFLSFGFKSEVQKKLPNISLSEEEVKLYHKIMHHRKMHGLPKIPVSKSLTHVAQTHCKDLYDNTPHRKSQCNMHSWSSKGKWSSGCYTRDHKKADIMWNKPKELTNYPGIGFEISHGYAVENKDTPVTAKSAIHGWKHSSGHNQVMINKGIWKRHTWNAIGIGIYKGYACVWFGDEVDPDGELEF